MTGLLWGALPYFALTLFFVVPFVRLVLRPYEVTTRASSMFGRDALGIFSTFFHWGLMLVFIGHVIGLIGGILGYESWISVFFWIALVGGVAAVLASLAALIRRVLVPEARALSQPDDYIVHLFLILIMGMALYQAVIQRIWGVAYTASGWFASILRFQPEPELMASSPLLTQIHVALALALAAYFPFTKLVHAWTLPVNYFTRSYQVMRTSKRKFTRAWDFSLMSDKGFLTYTVAVTLALGLWIGFLLPTRSIESVVATPTDGVQQVAAAGDEQAGYELYLSQCARCHGVRGDGDGAGAASPTFAQPPRDLTAGDFHFVSTRNGVASNADLRHVLEHGLPRAGMPSFRQLSPAQLDSLVAVLDRMWVGRQEAAERFEPGEPPAFDAQLVQRGSELFAQSCSACHGPQGAGDGAAASALAIPPSNLAAGEVKAGTDPEQLYYRVAAGIWVGGAPLMPSFGYLPQDDVWAIVAYLSEDLLP